MNIQEIINILTNKSGRLEFQWFNEDFFKEHDLLDDYNELVKAGVKDACTLYMFINNVSDKCSTEGCSRKRRFVSFKEGFKKYCEACARSEHN